MNIGLHDTRNDSRRIWNSQRIGYAFVAAAGTVAQFASNWWNRRKLRALYEFSPHELADIGITRQDLDAAYYGPAEMSPGAILRRRANDRRTAERDALRALNKLGH
ncbi:MAG: hypothetical protein C0606_15430 [Hyphomicrobiales bacterium]|nr:MAG: hypothetical protein C0606_15430 [Hyphomicrobiales bacterium]